MNSESLRSACDTSSGCREKTGVRDGRYGSFRIDGRLVRAHRVSWEVHSGPIPDCLYVCHRCNNKRCINPDHLYLATHRQNLIDAGRDGLMPGAKTPRGVTLENAVKRQCKSGHTFNQENTYLYPSGKRGCKTCRAESLRTYQLRNAETLRHKALARYHRLAELAKAQP